MRIRARALALVAAIGLVGSLSGVFTTGALVATAPPAAAYPLEEGYWLAAQDGGIFAFGEAQFFGSTGDITLNRPIVGMAAYPFLEGYWLVATDGGIFSFGSAGFYGSTGNIALNKPIVAMAPTPTGEGYWLVASDGGIFNFGDAEFFGSAGGITLNKPIVGMAPTPSGNGYWLVATDGGIFNYGDAEFLGSTGNINLNKPIVGMESSESGDGYYLVASDGGLFNYGDAVFRGSAGGSPLNAPIVGMEISASGDGYQLVATDGGVFNYGDSNFHGSTGNIRLNKPILGMALRPRLAVVADPFSNSQDPSTGDSNWVQNGTGDWQLILQKNQGPTLPVGARILGVRGLDGNQLGTLGFTLDSGTCPVDFGFVVFYDANRDGTGESSLRIACSSMTKTGNEYTVDAVAAGVPANSLITALDMTLGTGSTLAVDDIRVAGLTITDYLVTRAV